MSVPEKPSELSTGDFLGYTYRMADPAFVRTLDYILNHCDEKSLDAVAEAVVRRRRELAMTGGMPDPRRMAQELSAQINTGAGVAGLRETVRDMAVRIIKQHAPELTESQIAELTAAWIPGGESAQDNLPADLLFAMAGQFVNFSLGRMPENEDRRLRSEMGAWPERYWQAFPEVVKLIIKDLVDGKITEEEFSSKLRTALALERA
jgi:hypothetical protein